MFSYKSLLQGNTLNERLLNVVTIIKRAYIVLLKKMRQNRNDTVIMLKIIIIIICISAYDGLN